MQKSATLRDIAKKANVSVATVSRVVNENYPVTEKTKKIVQEAIREMNYSPNTIARSLKKKTTNTVGFVVADIGNSFAMDIAKGLEIELLKQDFQLIIATSGGNMRREVDVVNALIDRRIDAIVMAASDKEVSSMAYEICKSHDVPLLLVDRGNDEIDVNQLLCNNYKASYELVQLLLDNNHRKIGIINIPLSHQNGTERLGGFLQCLKDHDVEIAEDYISNGNSTVEDGYQSIMQMLSLEDPPTAVYCVNNYMVEGALMALKELNIEMGKDISIVAFGSLLCNKYITPIVTHARQFGENMGVMAGNIVVDILNNEYVKSRIVIDIEISEGGSVKKL